MLSQKKKYAKRHFGKLGVWEALEMLGALVDQSDPDTEMSQTQHALQAAKAARLGVQQG